MARRRRLRAATGGQTRGRAPGAGPWPGWPVEQPSTLQLSAAPPRSLQSGAPPALGSAPHLRRVPPHPRPKASCAGGSGISSRCPSSEPVRAAPRQCPQCRSGQARGERATSWARAPLQGGRLLHPRCGCCRAPGAAAAGCGGEPRPACPRPRRRLRSAATAGSEEAPRSGGLQRGAAHLRRRWRCWPGPGARARPAGASEPRTAPRPPDFPPRSAAGPASPGRPPAPVPPRAARRPLGRCRCQ
mmetsp:Transcript_18529/g.55864  ORF Transcript_18529/g.55864 Transcript_18529/m.55864 type:complete len:244 (-) Transcript_18529:66-797(-)